MTQLTTIDTNNYAAMAKAMGIASESASQKEKASCQKWPLKWVHIWGSIFNIFQYFWLHFCDLFSRLRLVATSTDFE